MPRDKSLTLFRHIEDTPPARDPWRRRVVRPLVRFVTRSAPGACDDARCPSPQGGRGGRWRAEDVGVNSTSVLAGSILAGSTAATRAASCVAPGSRVPMNDCRNHK